MGFAQRRKELKNKRRKVKSKSRRVKSSFFLCAFSLSFLGALARNKSLIAALKYHVNQKGNDGQECLFTDLTNPVPSGYSLFKVLNWLRGYEISSNCFVTIRPYYVGK